MGEFKKVEKIEPFVLKKKDPKTYSCLKELFVDWQEAHEKDKQTHLTFPEVPKDKQKKFKEYNGEFIKNFCPDGPLGDNSDIEILFICRESNVTGDIESNENSNNDFWFKDVVNNKAERPNTTRTESTYYNCMNKILECFKENNMLDKNNATLSDCAYMNINKRGGFDSCNIERLENYFLKYEEYILKEIELINPDRIVILGNLPIYIQDKIKSKNENIEVYVYSQHPSRYIKNDIEIFKNQLKKEKENN